MSDAAFHASNGFSRYRVGSPPQVQYMATGGSDDWARGEAGIKWVFLVELPDRGRYGFLLPPRFIRKTGDVAMASLRVGMAAVANSLAGY